jgi:hypothetical protein
MGMICPFNWDNYRFRPLSSIDTRAGKIRIRGIFAGWNRRLNGLSKVLCFMKLDPTRSDRGAVPAGSDR